MWLLPTHNRAAKCREVIEQIKLIGCRSRGVVFVNGTEQLDEYKSIVLPVGWDFYFSEENIGVCAAMNKCFELNPNEQFYGLICDDEYVYTPEWDRKLIMAAGRTRISHGNDHWQSKDRIHAYVTVGGDIVRALGWWALPGLWHWYHDDVQERIAKDLRLRRFVPEVRCEHRHYITQSVDKDATYETGESKKDNDAQVYHRWLNGEYPLVLEQLKKVLNT